MAAPAREPQPIVHIPAWLWLVLSALISLIITAGTGFIASASVVKPGESLPLFAVIVIIVGGLVQSAKDVRTYIAPSITNRPKKSSDAPGPPA